jgi:hypothetical protein
MFCSARRQRPLTSRARVVSDSETRRIPHADRAQGHRAFGGDLDGELQPRRDEAGDVCLLDLGDAASCAGELPLLRSTVRATLSSSCQAAAPRAIAQLVCATEAAAQLRTASRHKRETALAQARAFPRVRALIFPASVHCLQCSWRNIWRRRLHRGPCCALYWCRS